MPRRIMLRRLLPIMMSAVVAAAVSAPPGGEARDALRHLAERAESGDAEAMFRLAGLHERGFDSIPADSVKAMALYRSSAEAGYLPAMNQLGFLLMSAPEGRREAVGWLEKAALAGDAKACSNLGWLMMQPEAGNDYYRARYWLEKAAGKGLPVAMSLLGDLYRDGLGTPVDILRADSLYEEAFLRGLRDAGYKLAALRAPVAELYTPDECVEQGLFYYLHGTPSVGVRLFRRAANVGHPRALALLGDAYARAVGVDYDHDLSALYFARAAVAGDPSACFYVAETLDMFPDAYASFPDFPSHDASWWYDRAAQGGVTDAGSAAERLIRD